MSAYSAVVLTRWSLRRRRGRQEGASVKNYRGSSKEAACTKSRTSDGDLGHGVPLTTRNQRTIFSAIRTRILTVDSRAPPRRPKLAAARHVFAFYVATTLE